MSDHKYFISYEKNSFHLLRNDSVLCSASIVTTSGWISEDNDIITGLEMSFQSKPFRGFDIPAYKEFLEDMEFMLYSEFEQYVGLQKSSLDEHIEKSVIRKIEITDKIKKAVVVPPTA